jgi:3-oxoacyl-[acyl-carrier protein] reductase/pteridine reductase
MSEERHIAVVTGGNRGIGYEVCKELARVGCHVVLTCRNEVEGRRALSKLDSGDKIVFHKLDVTDTKEIELLREWIVATYGRLDILINNAANYENVEFEKLTLEQWDAIFASNTRGPFLVSQQALKWLRERKGRIINLGSLGGLRPWASNAHYCSSKAAVHMLTKVMAKALAPDISVNCVAPGMIDLGEKSAAAFMKRMAAETPMQRNGNSDDVAQAVLFFATAPQFITGQILAVDGGLSL